MAKCIKMLLYGEPGVGKSVFACKAPKPFFITTDGNYEWLEDFGAKSEDHKQVSSWEEAKQLFSQPFDNYDTIVVDLVEDLFKWCEQEYCTRSKLEHVSDVGYGKGYDITRSEFFLEISKLLGKSKHIILISHGVTFVTKDRRGVEHTRYAPSSRLPDKVLDMIEGRLRYCLRCYLKAEETSDGELVKKRYLSLVPKENEFGIIRGVDENTIPHDIPLEWSEFAKAIKLNNTVTIARDTTAVLEIAKEPVNIISDTTTKIEVVEDNIVENNTVEEVEEVAQTAVIEENTLHFETTSTDVKPEPVKPVETLQPQSSADKVAAIKAKLAALQAQKQK